MAWAGVGSGNLVAAAGDVVAFGTFSGTAINISSITIASGTITRSASVGSAVALPATPDGYITIVVSGATRKLPYFRV